MRLSLWVLLPWLVSRFGFTQKESFLRHWEWTTILSWQQLPSTRERYRCISSVSGINPLEPGRNNIQIVLGAAIGGILIAGGVGRHLGVKHIFSERVSGKMELRRGFDLPEGIRVLIVEDIITTGGSVFELIKVAESCGATIVGISSLIHRATEEIDFGYKYSTLLNFPVKSWHEDDVPSWLKKIEIIKPGRTGKK